MFEITKSIDVDFAHHVSGHTGKCINIHGHTWKFEVTIGSRELDKNGFVVDFGVLKKKVLEPVKEILDHSLVLSLNTFIKIEQQLCDIGKVLICTRPDTIPALIDDMSGQRMSDLYGGTLYECGGINVTAFSFTPTSERLAEWLHEVARQRLEQMDPTKNRMIKIIEAKVYEQLHPVEACAVYRR